MTTTTTRRALLARSAATAAMIPAAAIPASAATALASKHPDAELLALGRQYDVLARQYDDAVERWNPVWKALGQAREAVRGSLPDGGWLDLMKRVEARFPDKGPHPDDMSKAMFDPEAAIIAWPATTIAGLAVKAKVVRQYNESWWDASDADADYEVLVARKLIDAVIELAETIDREAVRS